MIKCMTLVSKKSQKNIFGSFSLPGSIQSPYFQPGRDINLSQLSMKIIIKTLEAWDFTNYVANITFAVFDGINPGNEYQLQFNIPVAPTDLSLLTTVNNAILTSGLVSGVSASDIVWPAGTDSRSFSNPSLAVNTSRQPSTTRDTMVNASIDITSTISLTTGQTGKVSLQYADNTGFTTNVVNVQSATNGNTGSLTIGLNLSQVYTAALTGIVPANKFYRLVTTNVTGTPTYGTPVIQEVLL